MLQIYRARVLMVLAAVVCYVIFWWSGAWTGFPGWRVEGASLLEQASLGWGIGQLIVTGIALTVCTLIGLAIAGRIRSDAGLFAASAGLMAMSVRGGTIGDQIGRAHV